MKKSTLKRLLDQATSKMALQRLNELKENHSKVQHISHKKIKMQNYLKANNHKMSQEETKTIFHLRTRVTNVKMNYRGKHENLNCSVCQNELESQKHILQECKILKSMEKSNDYSVEYEKLFGENVKKQIEIAKRFNENMNSKLKMEKL